MTDESKDQTNRVDYSANGPYTHFGVDGWCTRTVGSSGLKLKAKLGHISPAATRLAKSYIDLRPLKFAALFTRSARSQRPISILKKKGPSAETKSLSTVSRRPFKGW